MLTIITSKERKLSTFFRTVYRFVIFLGVLLLFPVATVPAKDKTPNWYEDLAGFFGKGDSGGAIRLPGVAENPEDATIADLPDQGTAQNRTPQPVAGVTTSPIFPPAHLEGPPSDAGDMRTYINNKPVPQAKEAEGGYISAPLTDPFGKDIFADGEEVIIYNDDLNENSDVLRVSTEHTPPASKPTYKQPARKEKEPAIAAGEEQTYIENTVSPGELLMPPPARAQVQRALPSAVPAKILSAADSAPNLNVMTPPTASAHVLPTPQKMVTRAPLVVAMPPNMPQKQVMNYRADFFAGLSTRSAREVGSFDQVQSSTGESVTLPSPRHAAAQIETVKLPDRRVQYQIPKPSVGSSAPARTSPRIVQGQSGTPEWKYLGTGATPSQKRVPTPATKLAKGAPTPHSAVADQRVAAALEEATQFTGQRGSVAHPMPLLRTTPVQLTATLGQSGVTQQYYPPGQCYFECKTFDASQNIQKDIQQKEGFDRIVDHVENLQDQGAISAPKPLRDPYTQTAKATAGTPFQSAQLTEGESVYQPVPAPKPHSAFAGVVNREDKSQILEELKKEIREAFGFPQDEKSVGQGEPYRPQLAYIPDVYTDSMRYYPINNYYASPQYQPQRQQLSAFDLSRSQATSAYSRGRVQTYTPRLKPRSQFVPRNRMNRTTGYRSYNPATQKPLTLPAAPAAQKQSYHYPSANPFSVARSQQIQWPDRVSTYVNEKTVRVEPLPAIQPEKDKAMGTLDINNAYQMMPLNSSVHAPQGGDAPALLNADGPAAVVYFDNGSAHLDAEDVRVIRQIVKLYKENPRDVYVQGHSSARTRNTSLKNQELKNFEYSLKRAEAVRDALKRYGVAADDLHLSAYGQGKTEYWESMPRGEAWNRRVEIYF